ncbi:sulfatase-like hydrolase/transferase [Lacrimispora sp. NSJ-141]|uniref:Sulfatase-like hydrolase/transferase n=1 Tax=Lientehia hominis TaxID=2897778 RepID=A0AAP2RHZ7_9FIRM|nr:alkaline phosphatase family protein [Lientehia hominis]MCD2492337.1 sulfatase-like hydrolase/transferase [Lientehia hominis]
MMEHSRTGANRGRYEYGSIGEEPRRRGRKPRGVLGLLSALGPILYFPMMLFYLEMAFHIYMGESLKYIPVWLFFSISLGFFLSLFAINFSFRVNRIITYVITILFSVVFCVEMMCKKILAQYYQLFSIAKTAAGNKLTDYMSAIVQGIVKNLFGLLLMVLPIIFIYVIGRNFYNFKRKYIGLSGVVAGAVVVTHLLGLLVIHLPWKGDYTPKSLYATDTNVDDQVQQLGVMNMLRLDLKHSLFGVKRNLNADFENPTFSANNTTPSGEGSTGGESDAVGTNTNTLPNGVTANTDTSPNVMNVDLESLAANAPNDDVAWLCKYFNSVTPSNKNQYTGMFKGYNVIFLSAEGFDQYVIDKEKTPTLYKLTHEGFVFNNFYSPLHYTSTSGGECQNLLGLYPKNGGEIIMQDSGDKGTNWYFSLAQQLNRAGYASMGFHANGNMYNRLNSHTNLGYKWFQDGTGLDLELNSSGKKIWPQSDLYAMEQSVDKYLNSSQPFNVYYMTISGHMPYDFGSNAISVKNRDMVADSGYSEKTQGYLAANYELDKALEYLLKRLEEAGIADKTLIVMAPDHIPYFDVDTIEELAGKSFSSGDATALQQSLNESMITDYDLYKNSLIIWSASMKEPVQVDKICGQVDILPTVSNLLGLEYDSRMLSGTDILSDAQPLVAFSSGCWKTDVGFYNRYTGEFTLAEGVTMDDAQKEEYVAAMKKVVNNKRALSEIIMANDAYSYIFPNTKNSSSVQ